jgi:curved DNA-binding protein CbpA
MPRVLQQQRVEFAKEILRKHEQFLQWIDKEDYYAVLGVLSTALNQEIEAAYQERWKEFLPKDSPGAYMGTYKILSSVGDSPRVVSEGCMTISGALMGALGVLKDPVKKKKYDAERVLSKSERARQETLQKIREGKNITMPNDVFGDVRMIDPVYFDNCFEGCFGRRPPILRDAYLRLKRYHDAKNPDAISRYLQAVQIQNLFERSIDNHKVSQKRKDIIEIDLKPKIDSYIARFEEALEYQYGIYPAELVFGEIISNREFAKQTHTFGFCTQSLKNIYQELKKYHEAQDLHARYDCVLRMQSMIERVNRGGKVPDQYKKTVGELQTQVDSLVEQYRALIDVDVDSVKAIDDEK